MKPADLKKGNDQFLKNKNVFEYFEIFKMDIYDLNNKNYYQISRQWRDGNLELSYLNSIHSITEGIIIVYKPIGVVLRELLDKLKQQLGNIKMAFSGRLDPMTHGNILIGLGSSCSLCNYYNKKDKSYHFKILVGASTDSGDILGLAKGSSSYLIDRKLLGFTMNKLKLKIEQKLPWYSSYSVPDQMGKMHQLWWWSQQGRIREIEQPSKPCSLYRYSIDSINESSISTQEIIDRIDRINPNNSNFRLNYIRDSWKCLPIERFPTIEMTVDVSSGFYIRQLVADISEEMNISMTVYEIYRHYLSL